MDGFFLLMSAAMEGRFVIFAIKDDRTKKAHNAGCALEIEGAAT